MAKKIVMFHPYVTKYMIKNVVKVLQSRFIGQGPKVDQFEEKIKKWKKDSKDKLNDIEKGNERKRPDERYRLSPFRFLCEN